MVFPEIQITAEMKLFKFSTGDQGLFCFHKNAVTEAVQQKAGRKNRLIVTVKGSKKKFKIPVKMGGTAQ